MRRMAREKMRTSMLITTMVLTFGIQYGVGSTVNVGLAAVDAPLMLKQIWDLIDNSYTWIRTIGGFDSDENNLKEANDEIYRRISNHISQISLEMDNLKLNFDMAGGHALRNLTVGSAKIEQIIAAERKLHEQLNVVQEEFRGLVTRMPTSLEDLNSRRLCEYGNSRLKDDSLHKKILKIFEEVYDGGRFNGTLMALLRENLPNTIFDVCGQGHSPHEYLNAIYNSVLLTEVQGFIALSFSYYFVQDYDQTNGCNYRSVTSAHNAVKLIYEEFELTLESITDIFLTTMKHVPRDFHTCLLTDVYHFPNIDIDQKSINQLQRLSQIVVVGSYGPQCSEIQPTTPKRSIVCTRGNHCFSMPGECRGSLRDCVDLKDSAGVCIARPHSWKRYDWVVDGVVGHDWKPYCTNEFYRIGKSGTSLKSICSCHCTDNHPTSRSTHLVNLQPIEADVGKNMVLTGIKFIVKHGVLQFQIQQGELLENWKIKNAEWKPINDISERISALRSSRPFRGEQPGVTEGVDFHVFDHSSAIMLSDVKVPDGHLLTGVKFGIVADTGVVYIAAISRPFNYTSTQLLLKQDDAPTISFRISETSISIRAAKSRLVFGQATLPLFVTKPLISSPSVPLGGLGMYLIRVQHWEMISLKAISVDYSYYMDRFMADLAKKIDI